MEMPAARLTDPHTCPLVPLPLVGGPISLGSLNVFTGFLPQARVTDPVTCLWPPPPEVIAMGSFTVFVNFLPAARLLDTTSYGGKIVLGDLTVLIG